MYFLQIFIFKMHNKVFNNNGKMSALYKNFQWGHRLTKIYIFHGSVSKWDISSKLLDPASCVHIYCLLRNTSKVLVKIPHWSELFVSDNIFSEHQILSTTKLIHVWWDAEIHSELYFWWFSVGSLCFHCQGPAAQSLIRGLRFAKPCGMAPKIKKK